MTLMKYTPGLVLLVMACAVTAVTVVRPAQPISGTTQANGKTSSTEQQQSHAKQPNGGTAAQRDQPDAKIYSPNCQKPKDHPEADLCVQRRMADAAEWQNWINSWGLGGLIATVVATGLAAVAAWLTVWTMQDTAKRQLRAYVSLDKGRVTVTGRTLHAILDLKNSGQTPAYDLTTKSRMYTLPAGVPFVPLPLENVEVAKFIVGPGTVVTPEATLEIPPVGYDAVLPAIQNGTALIYIAGRTDYRDIFGQPRFLNFRLRSSRRQGDDWILQPAPEGNEAD